MSRTKRDPAFAALRATMPPGVSDFMEFTTEKLYPHALRCAAKMGLSPLEAEEAAVRVVQAANGQLIAAIKRATMRDLMRAGKLAVPG